MRKLIDKVLRILPDSMYIRIFYLFHMKRLPNLRSPESFNEKLQWLKLNDRKPEYSMMVDKLAVKEWLSQFEWGGVLIPTLKVYNKVGDINLEDLPKQFVLKANHDSGSVVVCRDKSNFDFEKASTKLNAKLSKSFYWYGREWPYKNVKPCVFAEQYMEEENIGQNNNIEGLIDYKYFCFNGIPKFVYVSKGLENHSTAGISFYDLDGNEMPFYRSDFARLGQIHFPDNFKEMTVCAGVIAQKTNSPFVRVDLYSINGRIYFSEITFHPASGVLPFVPNEWDRILGELIDLSSVKANNK